MEFFAQNKENQKKMERLVLIIFTIYTATLSIGVVKLGWEAWVPGAMVSFAAVGWCAFLSKYRNFRIRAVITSVMMQFTIILYAAKTDNLTNVIPTFMAFTILVALYGFSDTLWITIASLFFIIFYHTVIHSTIMELPGETRAHLIYQIGNVLCIDFVLYVWLKNRGASSERMYQIIEALMDAEQSKDDFLANISHEIRTPVNTICGMSEMALREHDLEKMREEVFDIRDAGHNLMSLVTDILDFTQLQQGKMNLEEEAYNITSTINDIINMAIARKGEKQIELIVDCDASIPSALLGDEKKIRRVILNLVDNAIKFTNDGGIIIGIHARKENYGINLCISVKDTGIGIEEESLEKLFESFSQVDTRRNRQEGGVGLGLAISKALVQKMGGTITVKSRPGKGSTFRFVVPQKVLDEKPIGEVENREKLNVATYFDMEQFDMMTIRDEYNALIANLVRQLRVRCHACRNLAELMRREANEAFTHIFISLEEYQEDEAYFDAIAKKAKVIIVIDRAREKYLSNPDLIRLYKPFYILPVASVLNGSQGSAGGMQMVREGKFIAPDAHVLVVDDNRMNIRVVEGLLKEYQIKVTYATSGQEALKIIENMTYDFVFMDHMMPEMDGVETMHRIRDKVGHYYQRVPIIALTANAAPGNREMFLEEGFNDFVAKPLEVSVLERVLKRNLPEDKMIFLDKKELESVENNGADEKNKENKEDKEDEKGEEKKFVVGDLNVEDGLLYCGGREEYLYILEEHCRTKEENRGMLTELFEKQDWENYTIKVHALKSMMKNIGAEPLAAKAKALEMAGKKSDYDYILKNHEDMIAEYDRVLKEIEQCPLLSLEDVSGNVDDTPLPADLPELEEDVFTQMLESFENAVYDFDSDRMLEVISEMQRYRYHNAALEAELAPVRKKVEMFDYMSALDLMTQIRERVSKAAKGGVGES